MGEVLELDEVCCDEEQLPAGVSVGQAWLTGAFVATCASCSFVSAYFDCACELAHDCVKGEN